jgi:dihydroceramidase
MPPSYPDSRTGLWGAHTSTIDWCEENYTVTHYIAEFWNTVTNLAFIIPAAVSLHRAIRDELELRYVLAHAFMVLVGIGSLAFHCTLLYGCQMLDELPMLFGSCNFLYCMWTCSRGRGHTDKLALIITCSYALVTSAVYLTVNDPLFHELCYSIVVVLLTGYSTYQMKKLGGSVQLYFMSLTAYIVGVILWVMEVQLCLKLRQVRDSLSWPLQPVTQLHGWWHLLSGGGSHLHILFSSHMRMQQLGYPCKVVLYGGCIPVLEVSEEWTKEKKQ